MDATACLTGFKFGSIDLDSPGYLTGGGNRTFAGTAGNASTISWDPSTFTFTVVLGAPNATSGFGTVGSSAPVYTADPAIRDRAGAAVTNSPFALPAGRQF